MYAKVAVILSALLGAALAMPYTDCGSTSTLSYASITGCGTTPCTLQSGTNVTLTMTWIPHIAVENFHAAMVVFVNDTYHAHLPGLCDTEEASREHAGVCSGCSDLTLGECPLEAGTLVTYTRTFPVEEAWAEVPSPVDVFFKIDLEPTHEQLICFTLPIIVN